MCIAILIQGKSTITSKEKDLSVPSYHSILRAWGWMRKAISSGGGTTAFRGNERWRCWDAQKKYVLLPGCWLQLDANHFQLAKQPFVSSLASWNMALRWYLPITPWASYASFWVVAGSCIACLARFLWVMKFCLFPRQALGASIWDGEDLHTRVWFSGQHSGQKVGDIDERSLDAWDIAVWPYDAVWYACGRTQWICEMM